MPPKPLSKKRLAGLRRRFRDVIDWAFDGNLRLASRVLGMPLSTIQQYYQQGPRRISAKTLSAIDRVTGLADWLAGQAVSKITGKFPTSIGEAQGWTIVKVTKDGAEFWFPNCVLWRVDSVADAMIQRSPRLDRKSAHLRVVGSILGALEDGVLQAPQGLRLPATVGGRFRPDIRDLAGSLGVGRDAARQMHQVCVGWELLLKMRAP